MLAAYVFITANDMMDPKMMLAMALVTLFAPFSTAGYLGLIAKWAEGPMEYLLRSWTYLGSNKL